MKEQLLHILDQSVCLSRKQMKEYLSGAMLPEEVHAAEVHLNTCPLCRLALEGFETHSEESLQAIASLNSGFLKEHFDNISPQIHLNSMAPAASFNKVQVERKKSIAPFWRLASLAAGLLLLFGVAWAWKHRQRAEIPIPGIVNRQASVPIQSQPKQKAPIPGSSAASLPLSKSNQNLHTATAHDETEYVDAGFAVKKLPPQQANPNQEARKKEPNPAATTEQPAQEVAPSQINSGAHYYQEYEGKDETHQVPEPAAPASSIAPTSTHAPSESYSKATVEKALSTYLQGMNSSDPQTRYQFMILAAQCYNALGNKSQAEALLRTVIKEAPGHERRAARRALRRLQ
ncbi:MAG: hypothetical protein JST06_08770 [Bacteroidetes bacterium]|nr:hypothetical protein [Bacteroidota bacterium]MBS1629741.1 hypothetical protein [Bacteroidota bacterium]